MLTTTRGFSQHQLLPTHRQCRTPLLFYYKQHYVTLAPCLSRISISSKWPLSAATCNGVFNLSTMCTNKHATGQTGNGNIYLITLPSFNNELVTVTHMTLLSYQCLQTAQLIITYHSHKFCILSKLPKWQPLQCSLMTTITNLQTSSSAICASYNYTQRNVTYSLFFSFVLPPFRISSSKTCLRFGNWDETTQCYKPQQCDQLSFTK